MTNKLNLPPFYVGQKVVCVDKGTERFVYGKIYIVYSIKKSSCPCSDWVVYVGVTSKYTIMECDKCATTYPNDYHYNATLFAPIEETKFPLLTFEKIKETEKEEILIPN